MAITKITADVIDTGTITADNLNATLDLTGKTVTVATATAGDNDTTVASTAFVSTAIANLSDSAPSTLNTLNELAAALGDDANFSTTVTNNIATKLPLAGGTLTGALTTNGVINTGTSHNFAINTPNSLRINFDSNDSATDQLFVIGHNQTAVDDTNNVILKISEDGYVDISSGILQLATGSNRRLFYRSANNDMLLEAASGLFYRQDIGNTNHSWFVGNTERLRIDPEGNLSFGTQKVDPNWSQFFNAISGNYGGHLSFQNNNVPVTSLGNNFYINNSTLNERVLAYPTQQLKLDHQGNFLFESAASGTAGATFSFSEKMRITSGGDVGIGTTNPSSNLHVETNTHANIRIQAGASSSASLRLRNDAVDWDVNCQTNDNFAIYSHTAAKERIVIDGSGHTHISPGESNVQCYIGSQGGSFGGNSSHNMRGSSNLFMLNAGGSNGQFVVEVNGSNRGSVTASTSFQTTSDERIKKDIVDMDKGLTEILQLKPKKFKYSIGTIDQYGFIAQEVEEIMPDLITESVSTEDGVEITDLKSLSYNGIFSILVKAVQEQEVVIQDLKSRIEDLEG